MTSRVLRAPANVARVGTIRLRTRGWPDWSRLFVMGDALGWALDDEAAYVSGVARRAGYRLGPADWARGARRQAVFHTSHFAALDPLWTGSSHRLGLAYFHGRPGTPGFPEFDGAYEALRRDPGRFARVQVTHREMEEIVVSAGVGSSRVHRIPIGIELERFSLVSPEARRAARAALGLPRRRSSSGRSRRTGSGSARGSSRRRSRARTCSSRRSTSRGARSVTSSSCSRVLPGGTFGASSRRGIFRTFTGCSRIATG